MDIPGRRGLFIDFDSDFDFDFDPVLVLVLASPPPNPPSVLFLGDHPIRTEGPHRYRYRLEPFGFCGSKLTRSEDSCGCEQSRGWGEMKWAFG